jgi:hypothetical protein
MTLSIKDLICDTQHNNIMVSVAIYLIAILKVIMLSVVMLSVVAPLLCYTASCCCNGTAHLYVIQTKAHRGHH